MIPTELKKCFGAAGSCDSLQHALMLIAASAGASATRKSAAAYAMALVADQAIRETGFFEDARFVLDQLSRAKAEIDVTAWHSSEVVSTTAAILGEAQRFVDEETVACTEWPSPADVARLALRVATERATA